MAIEKECDCYPVGLKASQVAVGNNADGRLEIFYVAANDNRIYHNWQEGNALNFKWYSDRGDPLGGWAKQIAVACNADGRLEIFYVGTNNAIYHNWQVSPGGAWYGERALGGMAKQIAAERNHDGRLEIIYIGTDSRLYRNWQLSPGGAWHGEAAFINESAIQLTVARSGDGRLYILYVGTAEQGHYIKQQKVPSGDWLPPTHFIGFTHGRQFAVLRRPSGQLEAVFTMLNNSIGYRGQTPPPFIGWGETVEIEGYARQMALGCYNYSDIILFYIGTNGHLYYNRKIDKSWKIEVKFVGNTGSGLQHLKADCLAAGNGGHNELTAFFSDDKLYRFAFH